MVESKIDSYNTYISKFNLKSQYKKDVLHDGNLNFEGEIYELMNQRDQELRDIDAKREKQIQKAKNINEMLRKYLEFHDKLCINEMKLIIENYEKNRKQIMDDEKVEL